MSKNHFIAIVMSILLLSACSKKQADELKPVTPAVPGSSGAQLTYSGFVQPLFQSKCASCHAPGQEAAAVWNFNGYSSVTGNADRIKQAVLIDKTMPMTGSLSASELQSLKDWFDQGMPQ